MKLTEHAFPPHRATPFAAGFDLRSAYDSVVPKHGKVLIKTDIAVVLPKNCYGRIAPRSGLALKHFIDVGAGVIDRDYTGNVCVLLFNHSDEDLNIKRGERIAQLICEACVYPELYEVSCIKLSNRGVKGFGSTGLM